MKETNLVVLDDDENILLAVAELLKDAPYGIAVTTDPREAFEILELEKIKVIVADQVMPNTYGIEFLKKVKALNPDIIRILLTAYSDIHIAEEAINEDEVYRFIIKPWDKKALLDAINDAMGRFDLLAKNRELSNAIQKQNEDLRSLNEKLQNMIETQKTFTSTVSHELRTPLACIRTAIDILMAERPGKLVEEQKNFLRIADANINRLVRLVNDILDLAKMESSPSALSMELGDIHEVIRDVVKIQRTLADQKKINLQLELDSAIPAISFNPDKISQVLHNLIGNAIKFTDRGGVTVRSILNKAENHITICVKDTGIGIQSSDIPRLFQKFQQLAGPAKRHGGGTGLGLAISKEIIAQHRGKIWVESESGKGSSFYFLLPIKERRGDSSVRVK